MSTTDKEKKEITYTAREQAILDAYEALKDKNEADLKDRQVGIENAYARSLSTYGANSERLRSQGFTTGQQGGYSTFLDAEANRIRRQQNDDAIKAYNSLMQEATMKKDDALLQLDTEKQKAYSTLLDNLATGAYGSKGQMDAAKSAYESIYGKLDTDQDNAVYNAYLSSSGESIPPSEWGNVTDPAALAQIKDNYNTKMASTIPSILNAIASGDLNGAVDLKALFDDIDTMAEGADKEKARQTVNDTITRTINTALSNTTDLDATIKQIGSVIGTIGVGDDTSDIVNGILTSVKAKLPNDGTGWSFIGSTKIGKGVDRWVDLYIDGESYTIATDKDAYVDDSTVKILDAMIDASPGMKDKTKAEGIKGYAVALNGKIYYHEGGKWYATRENRSKSEMKHLKNKPQGYIGGGVVSISIYGEPIYEQT